MDFQRTVRATVDRYGMLSPGDRVLIGVSGGPDSMALWHVLRLLGPELSLTLKAVYVDHRLREAGARAEAGFVRSMGEKWGLPVEVVRLGREPGGRDQGSLEARVRSGRLEELERAADSWGADRIALGHQSDDHAETVLINLVRGSGLSGLAGIPPVRDRIIRPLIDTSRREVLDFLAHESVPYCRDRSNLEPTHLRNRVRHGLLPYLEAEFNPNMRSVLGRLADICRGDDRALAETAAAALDSLRLRAGDGEIVLDLKKLCRYNLSLRRRVIRASLRSLDPGRGEVESSGVESVLALAGGSNPGGCLDLGGGLVALREYDRLSIGPAGEQVPPPEPIRFTPPFREGVRWGGGRLRIDFEVVERPGDQFPSQEGPEAWFDPGSIVGPLTVRTRSPGDSIRPFASAGSRKLSDLFIDHKVPRRSRRWVPVVADGDGVVWVVGFRLAHRARVRPGSKQVLRGRVFPEPEPAGEGG